MREIHRTCIFVFNYRDRIAVQMYFQISQSMGKKKRALTGLVRKRGNETSMRLSQRNDAK